MRHRWWIWPCNDRGSAMLVALCTIIVLLLVGATSVNLSHLEGVIARRHAEYLQVSYLAEAGIERAWSMIFRDPQVLNNTATDYRLDIDELELQGQAVVTVTQPTLNGLLTIKSSAQLSSGAKKIWQAAMSAPPDYELYCRGVQLNPALDIITMLNTFGIENSNPLPTLLGDILVEPLSKGAYQEFNGDAAYFSETCHTHRYQPPAVEINFWQKVASSSAIDWNPYSFQFCENSITLPSNIGLGIYAVNGDALIYCDEGSISLQNCLVIANSANTASSSRIVNPPLFLQHLMPRNNLATKLLPLP